MKKTIRNVMASWKY